MHDPQSVSRIAILSAGTIGASWAAWFLSRGISCTVSDPAPDAEAKTRTFIQTVWPTLEQLGLSDGADPEAWRFVADPAEAVADAQFVQENAPERLEIKRDLYARIDAALPSDTILATSSSGLMMSDMQQGLSSAARLAVGHPFNPPHLIPLVEVVGGRQTDPAVLDWCMRFYRSVGKRPILLHKEVPGHLANRLQAALYREAAHAVAEGIASVADVDAAISYGPGLRWAIMGPHLTFHLGGGEGGLRHLLDHIGPAMEDWWETLGQPTLTPELKDQLVEGVTEEAAGRSIADLAAERDAALIALLRLLGR